MNTLDVIKEMQKVFPADMFIREPENSLKHLMTFEKRYHLNTSDFIDKNYNGISISEDDVFEWLNAFENFVMYNGNQENLNTIKDTLHDEAYLSNSEHTNRQEEFINDQKEEYAQKRAYSSFLTFDRRDYMVNFHFFCRVKH